MNAHDLTGAGADTAETEERLKSGVRAARGLAELLGLASEVPPWSDGPPAPLLPHDPAAFDREPPYPDCAEVLSAVAVESLGGDLVRRVF